MRKRIERLQKSLEQERVTLRTLIDNLPDGIFLKDRESRFIFANQVIAELMGAPDPAALQGKTDHDFYSREVADVFLADERVVMESRQRLVNREESKSSSGRLKWLTTKVPLVDARGEVTGLLGITRDVTERHEAEEKLRRSEQRYRDLLEQAVDGIFLLDGDGNFIMANSEICEMLGYAQEELLKLNILDTYPNEIRDVGKARFDAIKSGEKLHFECTMIRKDGSVLPAEMSARRLVDGTMQGIAHDITERKRFEEALRESEEKYHTIFIDAPVGIFHSTPEGKLVSVNPAFARMMGYDSPEQIIEVVNRKNAAEVLYEDPGGRAGLIDDLLQNRSWHRIETRYRRRDGGIVIAQLTVRSYVPPSATGPELEGFVEDITERRRAEQDLGWERSLFTTLMENLPDRIYFKDRMSRFIRTSRSHAEERGLAASSEEMGKTDADFSDPEHSRQAYEDEQRIIRTGMPIVDIEERVTYPGRPAIWFISTKMPLRDSKGTIVGTFGISHDITRRKQLEEKNQYLATLLNSADDAIVGTDLERRITAWNKGAERIYGYSAEEMIGAPISPLIPPESEDETRLIRERIMRGEQGVHFETTRLRKDGSTIIVAMTLSPICDPKRKLVGMASTARDVTVQKALDAQVNRLQRLESLAMLAGGVAHQFNNINTVVKGYLELMKSEKGLPARLASYVEAANAGVQKAVDITDRLLALTEPAGGSSNSLRLDLLARNVLALLAKRTEEEKVHLVLNLAETPPVQGDESRLKFVLSSLINNALDSLIDRDVRMVSIRTGNTKDAAYFEVEDTGCGVPEEDQPRVFSPFFSAKGEWAPPGSPQAKLKGAGLSLAISSTMVSQYGGKIEVQSRKGEGSTFRVELPLARQRTY